MRPLRLVALVVAMALAPASAGADTHGASMTLRAWNPVTLTAPVPCFVACPYWLDDLDRDIDDNGRDDIAFAWCDDSDGTADSLDVVPGSPFGRGMSYDEVIVGPAPPGARALIFEIYPEVDWDAFLCTTDGRPVEFAQIQIVPDMPCRGPLWDLNPVPTGCAERLTVAVEPDTRYVLRAFNWSDPSPLAARYCFTDTYRCGSGEVEGQFEALPCGAACAVVSPCDDAGQTYDVLAVPAGSSGLTLEVRPRADWDIVLCGADGAEVGVAANILGEPCDNHIGPANLIPIGCHERLTASLDPDETYEVRASNVADVYPAPYIAWFS